MIQEAPEIGAETVKVTVLSVVQSRASKDAPWREEGQARVPSCEIFETVARKHLGLYRAAHPGQPPSDSRVVRRIITCADQLMEW